MPSATQVNARDRNTCIGEVVAGRSYRLLAEGRWFDWLIRTDARGFPSPIYLRPFERRRRLPGANWFALVGFIAPHPLPDRGALDPPGSALLDLSRYVDGVRRWTCPGSGSLHVFANDLKGAYWNNRGSIQLSITDQP